jgi:hypothetical protein
VNNFNTSSLKLTIYTYGNKFFNIRISAKATKNEWKPQILQDIEKTFGIHFTIKEMINKYPNESAILNYLSYLIDGKYIIDHSGIGDKTAGWSWLEISIDPTENRV